MPDLVFPYSKKASDIFGTIYRPIARVSLWSRKISAWVEVVMIVDSGADYTLLPGYFAEDLGIDLGKDCLQYQTAGVGGRESVFMFKKARVRFGSWEGIIPVGFLSRDNISPLMGRHKFMEKMKVLFFKHKTHFSFPAQRRPRI